MNDLHYIDVMAISEAICISTTFLAYITISLVVQKLAANKELTTRTTHHEFRNIEQDGKTVQKCEKEQTKKHKRETIRILQKCCTARHLLPCDKFFNFFRSKGVGKC